MDTQFLEAVFTDSIQHPNFFNGRILTATDLRDEQAAELKRSRYLGQAIGTGVVYGLTVTSNPSQKSLVISKGLAINLRGDGLYLPQETTVELVPTKQLVATDSSPFVPCDIAGATTLTGVVSAGFYLLAITNATRLSVTMAPNSGLTGDRPGCTNRYEEVGVQFKLVPLTNDDFISPIAPTAKDSRSRLAHVCLGTNQLAELVTQPAKGLVEYGLVDILRTDKDKRLTDCDVPLAVFQFQKPALQFVDQWAVRRPAIPAMRPSAYADNAFTQFVSPRRAVEASAFLLQFQAHLEELRNTSSITPANVVAKDYFEYLPATGYLPVQLSSTASDRNFQVTKFFGASITEQKIAPVLLRSLFHESLYAEPIRPGVDAVDIYRIEGATDPYRIFVRRVPVLLPEPELPEEEEPPKTATGDLGVAVLSIKGKVVPDELIQAVQATHQATGKIYTAKRSQRFQDSPLKKKQQQRFVQERKLQVQNKYASLLAKPESLESQALDDLIANVEEQTVYWFNDLPVGLYTVQAIPTLKNYVGVSSQVKVKANIDNFAAVTIRPRSQRPPNDFGIDKKKLTPGGIIVDGFWVNPKWRDYYPNWERDIFGRNPVVDPPPDEWVRFDDQEFQVGLEELLALSPDADPRLVTDGAAIYIRRDYTPAQVTDTVAAFVQTPDGSRFPAVPLAADNALDKPASVDRTEIRDFDRATVDRLESAGLGGVDAIASAPTKLVAAILGQSTEYSQSLIGEARSTLQADFRNGYLGYAGITKDQSDQLKARFGSKVDLANASPTAPAITEVLGDGGFNNRFLADVRNTLPTQSFSLSSTGISAASQAALAGIGVASNKDLLSRGESEQGRTQLKETLGVSDATLNRYLETATLNLARGELSGAPEKSIGTLESVPAEVKASLVAAGIGSAKELANAAPAELSPAIGVSIAEATAIVNAAAPFGSNAHLTLITGATKGAVRAERVTEAGLTSAGAITLADTNTLTAIGIDVNSAQLLKNLSNQLLSESDFRRFR